MEYYSGGELFEHIVRQKQKEFTERQLAGFMTEIIDFLKYCHEVGLVHADLKPENIVLSESEGQLTLKVVDFGMSVFCRPHESLKNVFGTVTYCSPEMANKSCGQKTDVWSAGVILYFMFSGRPPFVYKTKEAVLCRLKRHPTVCFNREVWDDVSDEAKNFIRYLLNPSAGQRPTAAEALKHIWLSDLSFSRNSGFTLESEVIDLLRTYSQTSMLKRVLCEQIVRTVPQDKFTKQLEQFQGIDLDKNGIVDFNELRAAFDKVISACLGVNWDWGQGTTWSGRRRNFGHFFCVGY